MLLVFGFNKVVKKPIREYVGIFVKRGYLYWRHAQKVKPTKKYILKLSTDCTCKLSIPFRRHYLLSLKAKTSPLNFEKFTLKKCSELATIYLQFLYNSDCLSSIAKTNL